MDLTAVPNDLYREFKDAEAMAVSLQAWRDLRVVLAVNNETWQPAVQEYSI